MDPKILLINLSLSFYGVYFDWCAPHRVRSVPHLAVSFPIQGLFANYLSHSLGSALGTSPSFEVVAKVMPVKLNGSCESIRWLMTASSSHQTAPYAILYARILLTARKRHGYQRVHDGKGHSTNRTSALVLTSRLLLNPAYLEHSGKRPRERFLGF